MSSCKVAQELLCENGKRNTATSSVFVREKYTVFFSFYTESLACFTIQWIVRVLFMVYFKNSIMQADDFIFDLKCISLCDHFSK